MKKVILLGDSIRQLGYGATVEQRLAADGVTVWQPGDNCRFAQYTLRMLQDHRGQLPDTDIIHWNNGLWDVARYFGDGTFTSKEVYVATMLRIARILQQHAKVVIFATTTPTREAHSQIFDEDIVAFNAALVPELQKMGVVINDLYTAVKADVNRYIRADDNIHLSDEGIAMCAEQVERVIREQAQRL